MYGILVAAEREKIEAVWVCYVRDSSGSRVGKDGSLLHFICR